MVGDIARSFRRSPSLERKAKARPKVRGRSIHPKLTRRNLPSIPAPLPLANANSDKVSTKERSNLPPPSPIPPPRNPPRVEDRSSQRTHSASTAKSDHSQVTNRARQPSSRTMVWMALCRREGVTDWGWKRVSVAKETKGFKEPPRKREETVGDKGKKYLDVRTRRCTEGESEVED